MSTSNRPKALVAWSSGKDSAWALHTLRQQGAVEVVGLLTVVNQAVGRVAMHAVSEQLLEAQAAAAGVPLTKVFIPSPCSHEQYETAMAAAVERARTGGIAAIAFGDLFLEDVRTYREDRLAPTGITPLFPLWGTNTGNLARDMMRAGVRAQITCVDPRRLDASFAGRTFDDRLLEDLPPGVDPCGEHGEFHTFVHQGPMFARPIPIVRGITVARDGFVFADVLLGNEQTIHTDARPGGSVDSPRRDHEPGFSCKDARTRLLWSMGEPPGS